jgi:hypothetical protein
MSRFNSFPGLFFSFRSLAACFFLAGVVALGEALPPNSGGPASCMAEEPAPKKDWKPLLTGELKEKWEPTTFGGEGKVEFKDEELLLEIGFPLTGTTFKGEFPKEGFEIEMEANRLEGSDFLCGLTFPVGDGFCTYVGGGWGGTLVGLSCIDSNDAANNNTTQYFNFENKKWYKFRVRVDKQHITCWIDDKEYIKQPRDGHQFQLRSEVNANRPMGLAVYQSRVAVRNFKYRLLSPEEIAVSSKEK